MPSIDDRVVAMQFDNAGFEQKIGSTLGFLDKLKTALRFDGANKGLSDLNSVGNGFNLHGVTSAVEGVTARFSNLGIIAITVLQNITNKAVDAGIRLGKSLSLDQTIAGFREYETNMNSIQTVLSNTAKDGTTLNDVNKALDQLNKYSDQTIYNFGQMAKNIGTFTAAGVDLNTSVGAIKGIANLAAISGSSAEQASSAMYQLSQAISTGTLRLIDWNSVTNAGLGGTVFQEALFETGKALGKIKDTPIDQTFKEWTDSGNTFRGSLEENWLTAEVLTTTLQGFTGDLTEAQIIALGYTKEQAAEVLRLGKLGIAAATEVKTLTQLLSTVKESVGSGWSQTFKLIFGNFDEAKDVFTGFNNALGGIVGRSADARNDLLKVWKDFGGRDLLIMTIVNSFESLAKIVNIVKGAFHEVFPEMTAGRLIRITRAVSDFAESMIPTAVQLRKLRTIFEGVFSAVAIGIEVIKEVGKAFYDILKSLGLFNSETGGTAFFEKLAEKMILLKKVLVDEGGIANFIGNISTKIQEFIASIKDMTIFDKFSDAISNLGIKSKISSDIFGKAWNWVTDMLGNVVTVIRKFVSFVKDTFVNLPQNIADYLSAANYDSALDTLNVGLFGGFVLILRDFFKNGLNFGDGIFDNLNATLEGLTGALTAFQTQVKADAVLKIASSLALLTGSILVLSLIDPAALTKAMGTMALGFGQLVVAMSLLSKVSDGVLSAIGTSVLATGLVILAGAMVVLAFAVKMLSDLSWTELAKGLAGVAILLGVVALAVGPISDASGGMIRAGIGISIIAVAINILVIAVKSLSTMNWEELGRGLAGVAGLLVILAGAVALMPAGMIIKAGGILIFSVALNILYLAVRAFSTMNWEQMNQGLLGIGAALTVMALAVALMPYRIVLLAPAILLISLALGKISRAVQTFGSMDWNSLARGLVGLGGSLAILAGAMFIMQSAVGGAVAIILIATALPLLALGIELFANIGWKALVAGLLSLTAVFVAVALGAAILAPILPAMVGFSLAILAVGAGLALFGVGSLLATAAFATLLTALTSGTLDIIEALKVILLFLPEFIVAVVKGISQLVLGIVQALPDIVLAFGKVIAAILVVLIRNIPAVAEAFVSLVKEALIALREIFPELVETGILIIGELLRGIKDNIVEFATLAFDIMILFMDTLTNKMPEIAAKGAELLIAFLQGIQNHIQDVATKAISVLVMFIDEIAKGSTSIITAGTNLIIDLIAGIGTALTLVTSAAVKTIIAFTLGLQDNILLIVQAGWDLVIGVIDGIADSVNKNAPRLRDAGLKLAGAMIDGMTFGLLSKSKSLFATVAGLGTDSAVSLKDALKIKSPSRVMFDIGVDTIDGFILGIERSGQGVAPAGTNVGNAIARGVQEALKNLDSDISSMGDFTPTITPVLDLTSVESEARRLGVILGTAPVSANVSFDRASQLSVATQPAEEVIAPTAPDRPSEVKFEQNIYSPEALTTSDIYRQTNNQIALAKEVLAAL